MADRAVKGDLTDTEVLSRDQVLALLSQQALGGSVTATAALERALRARDNEAKENLEQTLDGILTK